MIPPIYLDNAATSFPKPRSVIREVNNCIMRYCGNPGRGSHALALESAKKIFECRELISELFGVGDPERVIFTMNTTHALNLFIKGTLKKGDHVIISDLEHNSVWRPICKLADEGIIEYDIFPSMCNDERANPARITAGLARLIKKNTRLVVCTHASNICSYSMPIERIGAFCRRHGILFAVDAAQSAGHLPLNMDKMQIDAICAPGHKGLYGIQGAGFLALSDRVKPDTLTEGGNGLASLEWKMSDDSPERYEAGTLPTPAIVGLAEGIKRVSRLGLEEIAEHERALFRYTAERLCEIPHISLHLPQHEGAVLLFSHKSISSERFAALLGDRGICVRGGFHCSALGHKTIGTLDTGAVRASFGIFTSSADINNLISAVNEIKQI